jgi:hypothetical protein
MGVQWNFAGRLYGTFQGRLGLQYTVAKLREFGTVELNPNDYFDSERG